MATRRVVPVVETVELPAGAAGPEPLTFDVRSFLLVDESGVVLVDTGLQADAEPIARELQGIGATWGDISDVILTHAHADHSGGVGVIARMRTSFPCG